MDKKSKKIFFSVMAMFFIILIFLFGLLISLKNEKNETEEQNNNEDNSLEIIINKTGSKFKKMKNNTNGDFQYDIYLEFKCDLYDGNTSNKEFYDNIIESIGENLGYYNFRLIDEKKNIKIEITCSEDKIDTICINGIEDYFIYTDSKIELNQYEKDDIVEMNVISTDLKNCINKNWKYGIDFGTRESIFQEYYIYFDEGIKVRSIGEKIYNIIFTNKYQNEIIENIRVGMDNSTIRAFLGNPTYTNDDETIIGYKTKDFYIFFEEDQISIYRNDNFESYDEFFNIIDEYLNKEIIFKEFMNKLTDLWNDYSEYDYDSDYVFISYPNKGVEIKVNYDNANGIIFYNNVGIDKEKLSKYLEHTEFTAKLSKDGVFEAEKRRVKNEKKYEDYCYEYHEEYEEDDSRNKGKIYDYYAEFDVNGLICNMYFISNNEGYFNCQLKESISSYYWYNEYILIYSKAYSGIYYYNLVTQEKGTIVTGDNEKFIIKSIDEDGWINYDNHSIKVE